MPDFWIENALQFTLRNTILLSKDQGFWSDIESVVHGDSDVGDIVMSATLWLWLVPDVGGRIIMLATFFGILVIFLMY